MSELNLLLQHAEQLLSRLEVLLLQPSAEPDWSARAYRWHKRSSQGYLQPVLHPHAVRLVDLRGVDTQKATLERNTRQFIRGLPANNVLLTGARGTGKSSLIKALLTEFGGDGLRLVAVDKHDLADLHDISDQLATRPERYIVFCDDLSFEAGESGFKALKVALDGSIAGAADNMLIYATSNRRHLMPESMAENLETQHLGGEIRPGETTEEKVALSERFGIWLAFYPFDQDEYLDIVRYWLHTLGIARLTPQARRAALQWAQGHGSRSGRVAWQFARDWAGQQGLRRKPGDD